MLDGSHHGVVADEHERRMLRLWIDVGAPYPGTYAALGTGSIGGYAENKLVNTDTDWPTTLAGAEAIQRRCADCHQGDLVLPKSMSDERGVSFWRFEIDDPASAAQSAHRLQSLAARAFPAAARTARSPPAVSACAAMLQVSRCRCSPTGPTRTTQYLLEMVSPDETNWNGSNVSTCPVSSRARNTSANSAATGSPPDHPDDAPVDPYQLDRQYWEAANGIGSTGTGPDGAQNDKCQTEFIRLTNHLVLETRQFVNLEGNLYPGQRCQPSRRRIPKIPR
jgi:hypothetical protein